MRALKVVMAVWNNVDRFYTYRPHLDHLGKQVFSSSSTPKDGLEKLAWRRLAWTFEIFFVIIVAVGGKQEQEQGGALPRP